METCCGLSLGHYEKAYLKRKHCILFSIFVLIFFIYLTINFLPDGYLPATSTEAESRSMSTGSARLKISSPTCKIIQSKTIETLPTDKATCIEPPVVEQGPSFAKKPYQTPACTNLRKNIVDGKWVERNGVEKEKHDLDELLANFRLKIEGFSSCPFRADGKCGFKYRLQHSKLRPVPHDASAWCFPHSDKPCCSDIMDGRCVVESQCTSPRSVNLAKFVHAEISDWVPHDSSCAMAKYDQESACALLHAKNVKSIGFIGDSHMRNFYSASIQMLQNNFYNGSILSCVPPSIRKKCINQWQNLDKFCLHSIAETSKLLHGHGICNGHLDTLLYCKQFYVAKHGQNLKRHIEEFMDKPGTYLVVGIGVHDGHNADVVINNYLQPTFQVLTGHKWPKFLWVHPLKTGLFKPPSYVRFHGNDDDIDRYVNKVELYCQQHNIPTLDSRGITTGVWSSDGTHYGTGVNLMKIQMFLNFLASDEVF